MKKIIALLVALVMAMSLTVATGGSANADKARIPVVVKCVGKYSQQTTRHPGPRFLSDFQITARVYYESCTNQLGPHFARPRKIIMYIKFDKPTHCNDKYAGVADTQFTPYFKTASGSKFYQLRRFSAGCSGTTVKTLRAEQSYSKRSAQTLIYDTRGAPYWKINFQMDWRGMRHDPQGSIVGKLAR